LAKGHLKALNNVLNSNGLEAYNLGTGRGYSVLEVIKTFERTAGINIPYKVVGRRPGDVAVSYADPSKAKRELGWEAKKDLEAINY
jgi:UDP-glucose 4-epimerase